jgi:hypothetical protein
LGGRKLFIVIAGKPKIKGRGRDGLAQKWWIWRKNWVLWSSRWAASLRPMACDIPDISASETPPTKLVRRVLRAGVRHSLAYSIASALTGLANSGNSSP